MNNSSNSTYALALYDLIDKSKKDEYVNALKEILLVFEKEKHFFRLLAGYSISNDEKEKIVEQVFGSIKLEYISNFIKLLVAKHKLNNFKGILQEFLTLVNDSQGIKEGILYTAFKLDDKQIKAIQSELEKALNCKVSLTVKVDQTLLGGAKVAIDGKVYDGSLRSKLLGLKKKLTGGIGYEN